MIECVMGYGYRAGNREQVIAALELARSTGRPLVARGSGYSYGDIALNAEQITLDMTGMNRILDWNPAEGSIRVEPGVTIRDLWRYTIGGGWWPAVVPGAMAPTVGGCLAVNAHGKNNWRAGTFSDHVVDTELLLPSGEIIRCGPAENSEIWRAAAGGIGMPGIFLSVTIRLTRIESGILAVHQLAAANLDEMFTLFEGRVGDASYLVGWIDGFATGGALGRGLVQAATPGPAGEALDANLQDLPPRLFGTIPRSKLWLGMKPAVNDAGMRALNTARFRSGELFSGRVREVPLAQFHFFHDYVPNWKRAFRPGGIVQYQVFLPGAQSRAVFGALLTGSQKARWFPYLAVMKRHRADDTLLGYNVDGYSLSLDYHATIESLPALRRLLGRFTDEVVLPAGGRFYLAKDSILTAGQARRAFGDESVETFMALKRKLDPGLTLQSNLFRRLFSES